ncbi:MAG: FAD:protein FMN transferase [Leptospirales bacterium]
MHIIKKSKFIFFLLLLIPVLAGCGGSNKRYTLDGTAFGTTLSVNFYRFEQPDLSAEIEKGVNDIMAEVDASMSTYRDDSEISKFNNFESKEPFEVSKILYELVNRSLEYSKKTDGALDITVLSLVEVWGFGREWKAKPEQPDPKKYSKAVSVTGYWNLSTFKKGEKYFLQKKTPGLRIDLSSIGKGYTVDRISELLMENSYDEFMVDIGGEIRTGRSYRTGSHSRQLWKVGIEKPDAGLDRVIINTLNLEMISIATSGRYRNSVEIEGKEYSHLIDARKGRPVENHIKSVTVLAKNCAEADAYATALTIMGEKKALQFAEKNSLAVYILSEKNGVLQEASSSQFLKITGQTRAK